MEFVFAYAAGVLTLINPCVLPVLPIVLAGALQADRLGPLALAAGMSVSFVALGLGVTAAGHLIGLTPETIARFGAILMVGFGLVLLVPRFSARFAAVTAGPAGTADTHLSGLDQGALGGQFLGGILLGAVWSPCIGPTLGGAIALASQGQDLVRAGLVMAAFAGGVATLILVIGYGARAALLRNRAAMHRIARAARPALGAVFVAVGLSILFGLHHVVEAWALDVMPIWLQDLSVSL
jgi:cytochrome c biogenesis protein CcdA